MEEGVPVAPASNQVEHVQETWQVTEPLASVVLSYSLQIKESAKHIIERRYSTLIM